MAAWDEERKSQCFRLVSVEFFIANHSPFFENDDMIEFAEAA